ncbi:hypothetical protein RRSWK_00936 [Rhodopirellula sp. SWK7]|nr:hypothetical protein RRSWK_00936 [Rhodopirellula sp. SWK7]
MLGTDAVTDAVFDDSTTGSCGLFKRGHHLELKLTHLVDATWTSRCCVATLWL